MAERSIIDQLDDAVAALAEGRQADLTNLAPELSALVEVAQGLVGLPRETFKAELQQQLIRRDVMSSPVQPDTSTLRTVINLNTLSLRHHQIDIRTNWTIHAALPGMVCLRVASVCHRILET